MRGVERRPGQEAHQQFKAGLPGNISGEQRGSRELFSVGESVDLVGNIRTLIQQEKASHSRSWVERYFNAPMWLRGQLNSQFHEKEASKIAPRELAGLALDLLTAWDVVA